MMKSKVFSERHGKALKEKKIQISLRQELRKSLVHLFHQYSQWDYDNEKINTVSSAILSRRGWDFLQRWDGKQMTQVENFEDFIEHGTPHHVLDAIELFIEQIHNEQHQGFISELNNLFEIHHSPIRFFRNEFYVVDSAFLESAILSEAQKLLETTGFNGALDEFMQARGAYMEKDFKRTILMANHALESTMKAILEMPNRRTSELIKKVCHSGLVPSYYEGFLDSFHDFVSIVPTTRDNEAGHGQGKEIKEISPALAELSLHLSGSMIVFLIKRHIEKEHQPQKAMDDVPF